jgi:hypothetical protein
MPARQRVPDRFDERALFRQQRRLHLEPGVQSVDDWLGATVASRKPFCRRLTLSVSFDGIKFADTVQRLYRHRRVRGLRHVVELASRVAPACGEHDIAFISQRLQPGIAVDMKNAAEALQMRGRTFSFAVRRIQIDRSRRVGSAPCSLLAGVHPKPSRLGAPSTWIEHRNGRVIGEQMVRREHVSGKALMQRLEPPAGSADASSPRRTWKIDPVAGEDLLLPIQGRVVAILADQHLGEQRGRRQAAGDRPFWRRRLRHRLASPTGVCGTSGADDVQLSRNSQCRGGPLRATNGGQRLGDEKAVRRLAFRQADASPPHGRGRCRRLRARAQADRHQGARTDGKLRPLQRLDDRPQALDLAVAILDGGSHIANEMLQKSRFGRQIVEIDRTSESTQIA